MKRIVTLITVLALGTALSANAQDPIMSKKGTPIVYEAGDWGIGIDAIPFLEYLGNLFNNTDNNSAPTWNYPGESMVISGFKIVDANNAYRGRVGINFSSNKQVYKANNDADSTGNTFVDDEQVVKFSKIVLGAGIQKMRGKGRLRGIYGAEAQIGFGGATKTENTYGNAITSTNTNPSTAIPGQPGFGGERTTESKTGSMFMIGVRGFIGAEYFFAPKISLTGEFGWGPSLTSTGEGETTTEEADFVNGGFVLLTKTTNTGKSSSFNFGADNASGALRANFYF